MSFNPHSLHQILARIREQMRCPQCGTHVAVDFPSIKLVDDEFMLLQLRCESCTSFIVLHVNLSEQRAAGLERDPKDALLNASSTLTLSEEEMITLRNALQSANGSFEKLFQEYGKN